jgi:NitT/TauT family transport system substrate-binding protein
VPRTSSVRIVALAVAAAVVLAGCSPGSASPSASATKLTVGLGFIPSVQFAQFYLADQAGYYRAAGLEVTFQNKIDPDLITLIGQGAVDIGMGDGTSVIPAASQGIPIRYVAAIYARFPNVVLARADSGITTPADLRGKRIGTPGRFGSGWIMLQALLRSASLTPADVDVQTFPDFTQATALQRGAVDAATGFANNEPIQLGLQGIPTTLLRVDDITPLPGPGLCASTKTLETKRDAVKAFVAATLRAMREIQADPEKGLGAAIARVPELGQTRDTQRAILQATIDTWQSPYTQANGLGAIDKGAWQASIDFMRTLPDGVVPNPVSVDQVVAEGLIDG